MELTKEEAEKRKNDLSEFIKWCAGKPYHDLVLDSFRAYQNEIDEHTAPEYPCPGCGEEMEELQKNEYHCTNLRCPITSIKAWDFMSKFDFSKALRR